MKFQWTWIACLLFMTSCGKEIPNDVIQPEKMEKVLYDYVNTGKTVYQPQR